MHHGENGMFNGYYKGKKVFVTGHTGFKGTWLCRMLSLLGAEVMGYALQPESSECMFTICGSDQAENVFADIRDLDTMKRCFERFRPEIVFHLAAQPIVRTGYAMPAYTFETNVMGTVNVLECIRTCSSVVSAVNITTDKVYRNDESGNAFVESDVLGGADPYSNSKSCSELVTQSYRQSFFADHSPAVSTARAGNVIGGGDFADARIIPDCIRAVRAGKPVSLRNPYSIRPYQHVLEPLTAYLLIAYRQWEAPQNTGCYNIGPDVKDCVTTGRLAELFCKYWGSEASWISESEKDAPKEANFLRLECSKIEQVLGFSPSTGIEKAVSLTVDWTKAYLAGNNMADVTDQQIQDHFERMGSKNV